MSINEFIIKANQIHNNKYEYVFDKDTITVDDTIVIVFNGNKYIQKVSKHLLGRCPEKNTKRKTTEDFIEEAKSIWGNKYDYSLVEYKGALIDVKIIFNDKIYLQRPTVHLLGCKCEDGKKRKINNKKNFIDKVNNIFPDKYDFSKLKYISHHEKVEIIYKNISYFITPSDLLKGICPEKNNRSNTKKFIEKSNIIHKNSYDYSNVNYINNRTIVSIKCKKHGIFEQLPRVHINGHGCPSCYNSKGEEKIELFLIANNIEYKKEYFFENCKNKSHLFFDFYLPKLNIVIEYDGIQHFQEIEYFGGKKTLDYIKNNDLIKDKFCKENNIKMIRINYTQFNNIEEILNSLFNIFIKS